MSAAVYRLPQFLTQLAGWLAAEADAGRITSDRNRPPGQLASDARAIFSEAVGHAESLAAALTGAHNLTATLRAAESSAAP